MAFAASNPFGGFRHGGGDGDVGQVANTIDSLTSVEREWLVKNIIDHGETVVLRDSTRASRLNDGVVNLVAVGDSVTGTVTIAMRPSTGATYAEPT